MIFSIGDWVRIIDREEYVKIYKGRNPDIEKFSFLLQYTGKIGRIIETDWHYGGLNHIYRVTCDDGEFWWSNEDLIPLPTKQTFKDEIQSRG